MLSCTPLAPLRQGTARLFGGDSFSGILEVLYNGKWGMVCHGGTFDETEARTVCRELGFYEPRSAYMVASARSVININMAKRAYIQCDAHA